MGGGGAMKTAMMVAFMEKGGPLAPPSEQSIRKASQLVSKALLSQGGTKAAEVAPLHTASSSETNYCEFADKDELVMPAGEPMPRVVFGGAPSYHKEEAATSELKDAIDQLYLSSNSTEGSSADSKTESRVIKAISTLSAPNHAVQALKLLSESSKAQTFLASIACDPNVRNAVMQSPVLKDFVQSQKKTVEGYKVEESHEKLEYLSGSVETDNSRNGFDFMGVLQNIKFTVAEKLSKVSNYLPSIFNFSAAEKSSGDDAKTTFGDQTNFGAEKWSGNYVKTTFGDQTNFGAEKWSGDYAKTTFCDQTIFGGTFFGLVVLVAMLVILRRI